MDKLCINCKHMGARLHGVTPCLHERNIIISPVDGQREAQRSVVSMRENNRFCGPTGELFEAKK